MLVNIYVHIYGGLIKHFLNDLSFCILTLHTFIWWQAIHSSVIPGHVWLAAIYTKIHYKVIKNVLTSDSGRRSSSRSLMVLEIHHPFIVDNAINWQTLLALNR